MIMLYPLNLVQVQGIQLKPLVGFNAVDGPDIWIEHQIHNLAKDPGKREAIQELPRADHWYFRQAQKVLVVLGLKKSTISALYI